MKLGRAVEFFQDNQGQLSMARLLQFLAWLPTTGVMIYIHTTEAMSLYITAFVLNGVVGKAIDIRGKQNVGKSVTK